MTGNMLLDKMELVDPAYVAASDAAPPRKFPLWSRWLAAAACLALLLYAGVSLLPREASLLPTLPLSGLLDEGMGCEAYWAHDCSELVDDNPWREDSGLTVLPVYQNPLTHDATGALVSGADPDKMRSTLLAVAARLGLDTKDAALSSYVPEGASTPEQLWLQTDGLRVEVDTSLTTTLFFDPAIPLPDAYRFGDYPSYEDTVALAEYLKTEYRTLLGMEDPQTAISGGYYDRNLNQCYSISCFDGTGSETDRLLHHQFHSVDFYCEDDALYLVRIHQPDLSQKVGDYPIISPSQAEELLSTGHYLTSVPDPFPGTEQVKKAELIYRTGEQEAYFMPYYCFYVELPDTTNGLHTYGAYYVPAVDGAYLSHMPVWDEHFDR